MQTETKILITVAAFGLILVVAGIVFDMIEKDKLEKAGKTGEPPLWPYGLLFGGLALIVAAVVRRSYTAFRAYNYWNRPDIRRAWRINNNRPFGYNDML